MPDENGIRQYHKYHRTPLTATDIIIEYNAGNKQGIVLITRKNPPFGIAIPGGFAEYGLTLEQNAQKEAKEETNLEIILEEPEHPLCVHSNPARDKREHIISVTYVAKGYGELRAGDDAKTAALYTVDEVKGLFGKNKLAFDHEKVLVKYLRYRGCLQ